MKPGLELNNHRVLVIDPDPAAQEEIRKILGARKPRSPEFTELKRMIFDEPQPAGAPIEFEVDAVPQGEEGFWKAHAAEMAGSPYGVAFVDLQIARGWDGVETISRIREEHPDLQIVICTAFSDQRLQEFAPLFERTANVVILKKPLASLEVKQLAQALADKWSLHHRVRTQRHLLEGTADQRTAELQLANDQLKAEITERMQMEKALRRSEERFSKAFKASPVPLAIHSLAQQVCLDANQGFLDLAGLTREELVNRPATELKLWDGSAEICPFIEKLKSQETVRNMACKLRTKSGQLRDILLSVELFELGSETCLLTIAQDMTEQFKLEDQLRQSQKMEAVGQLAAGVAHDFNNLLTVVKGYSTLLLSMNGEEITKQKPLQTISAAADRASTLVRQLLTFSRKQVMQLRPLNVRTSLASMADMLPRLIGEHLSVQIVPGPDLPAINADPSMIEQMLINLAVNARDAMSEGGRLTISAEAVQLSPEAARGNQEARPGQFICIAVSDNGCGIAPENLSRIFEPFFTTKAVGKGTGLGLSISYDIIKTHGGEINIESE